MRAKVDLYGPAGKGEAALRLTGKGFEQVRQCKSEIRESKSAID